MRMVIMTAVVAAGLAGIWAGLSAGEPSRASRPGSRPATASAPAGVLLEYSRTGGFAGLQQHMVIQQDGSGQLVAGRPTKKPRDVKLGEERLAALTKALAAADLSADRTYKAAGTINDGFYYSLIVKGHTIKWETQAKLPDPLAALARLLEDALTDASKP